MTKAPKYVIAPEGCADYLTPGKRYQAIRPIPDSECGFFFCILNDGNLITSCSLYRCLHLNGGDWIITDDAEVAQVDDERRFIAACHAMQSMGTWMPDYTSRPDLNSDEALRARAEWVVRQADTLLAALKGDRHD